MYIAVINFFKRTYKIWVVVIGALIFFLGYNTYLVDRSLVNLRFALDMVDNVKTIDDAQKIALILDQALLEEIGSKEMSVSDMAKLELAKEVLTRRETLAPTEVTEAEGLEGLLRPQARIAAERLLKLADVSQIEDAKFSLREVISKKEKKRTPLLALADRIATVFAPSASIVSKKKLANQLISLKRKADATDDASALQEIFYQMAVVYTQLSDFFQAREFYEKVIALNPRSQTGQRARFNIAWNEKLRGNLDAALEEFNKISQEFGKEELAAFSQYQTAEILRKKGDYEAAVLVYQKVASEYPASDLARLAEFQTGSTYLYDLKQYEKALGIFENIKSSARDRGLVNHIREGTLPAIGRMYRADGFMLLKQGYSLNLPERYPEALKNFDKALEIDANDGIAQAGKALAYLWLNEPQKAIDFAKQAVKSMPNLEVSNINLGYIYIELELFDEAIAEFKRFVAVYPLTPYGYYNLGFAYAKKRKFQEAATAFHQATRIDPKFALAFNNLGWSLLHLGRFSEAKGALERAIELEPALVDSQFNLGLLYRAIGKYEDALKAFRSVADSKSQLRFAAEQQLNSLELERIRK